MFYQSTTYNAQGGCPATASARAAQSRSQEAHAYDGAASRFTPFEKLGENEQISAAMAKRGTPAQCARARTHLLLQ